MAGIQFVIIASDYIFNKSQNFRTLIYLNFGVVLQENEHLIPETEYPARSKCFRVGGNLSLVGGAPQWVQGKALVGVQGAKPPEAPGY